MDETCLPHCSGATGFLALVLAVGSAVANPQSVDAALPGLTCGQFQNEPGFCVSFNGSTVQAGMKNNAATPYEWFGKIFAVELVHFPFENYPNGSFQASAGPWLRKLEPGQLSTTRAEAWWMPGVYCASLYVQGQEQVFHRVCVDTNGVRR